MFLSSLFPSFAGQGPGTALTDRDGCAEAAAFQTTAANKLAAEREVASMREIADQLVSGYWRSEGHSIRRFDVEPGDTLNVNLSGLTADGQRLARAALDTWADVTGLKFNTAPRFGATVHIVIDDRENGAHSTATLSGGRLIKANVNVGRDWLADYGTDLNSYSLQTFIHEIGHALGLGHAGNYNGSADYASDALFLNDSWQASVMSYFSQTENSYIDADKAFVVTPMIADILAIQTLYGTPGGLRADNTVYGTGSTAGGMYDRAATMTADPVAWTILDQGGWDRLDLRGAEAPQLIDLRPGAISDIYGAKGNLSIASGTVIEAARGGSGNDRLIGNGVANVLNGGGGSDIMRGGAGNDIYHSDGLDRIVELPGQGIDRVISTASCILAANVENLTLAGGRAISGTGNGLANVITGNAAANRLTGGAGADSFVFATALGRGNVDRITDFSVADDTIRLDDAIFRALPRGSLADAAFAANAAGRALDALDRILYETDTGALWYDRDGTGAAAAVRFAWVTPELALTAADFLVI
ncbi:M10 family metallopeptidase [Cereibacter sphaeroides]|uniref:M10 family metallopeptidase n=1 Tax=Cereibacter sphaeroides TaxID=1063 RepID=UPI000191C500|nr:M10 family metallopeptidase [Cereibacter sphaeroides]ACM01411.1 Serralysin [Cereibacter sphaeroides KD131]